MLMLKRLPVLKVGMVPADVLEILGSPPHGMYPETIPGPSKIVWNDNNESLLDGGVRLELMFDEDRLVSASSWVRTNWREFVAIYCPGGR
jgi:hypothetical protein